MMSAFTGSALTALLSAAALCQTPTFEVASVKPAVWRPPSVGGTGERGGGIGGGCPTSLRMDRGRVDVRCATVAMLIGYAYRISPDRVTGPAWMMSPGPPRFDTAAKIPQDATENQVPEMFQALLAERFKLALHRATATQAIYALVVAKSGPKLKAAAATSDPPPPSEVDGFYGAVQTSTSPKTDGGWISNPRMGTVRETEGPNRIQRWEAPGTTMEGLADLLDKVAPLPSPIVDMTKLKGRYRLVLEVSMNDLSRPQGADPEEPILRAFNDGLRKLGLQLQRRKGPLETLIVDHVEKTPTGN